MMQVASRVGGWITHPIAIVSSANCASTLQVVHDGSCDPRSKCRTAARQNPATDTISPSAAICRTFALNIGFSPVGLLCQRLFQPSFRPVDRGFVLRSGFCGIVAKVL